MPESVGGVGGIGSPVGGVGSPLGAGGVGMSPWLSVGWPSTGVVGAGGVCGPAGAWLSAGGVVWSCCCASSLLPQRFITSSFLNDYAITLFSIQLFWNDANNFVTILTIIGGKV